jgi:hypothetical protein
MMGKFKRVVALIAFGGIALGCLPCLPGCPKCLWCGVAVDAIGVVAEDYLWAPILQEQRAVNAVNLGERIAEIVAERAEED